MKDYILESKIKKFRELNIELLSDEEILDHILNVISGVERNLYVCDFPVGRLLYRIRKLNEGEYLKTRSDFWHPPNAKGGRINYEGQPVLYACIKNGDTINALTTAMEEANISNKNRFAIIVYRTKEVFSYLVSKVDDSRTDKSRQINDFIVEQFLKEVFDEEKFFYRVTQIISKYLYGFDFKTTAPEQLSFDAILYPSVKTKEYVNICLTASIAQTNLEVLGAAYCNIHSDVKTPFVVEGLVKYEEGNVIDIEISKEVINSLFPKATICVKTERNSNINLNKYI